MKSENMAFKYLIFLSLFLLASAGLHAQEFTTRKTTNKKALKFYEAGYATAKEGSLDKALRNYEKALEEDPILVDALIQTASVYYDLGELEQAVAFYRKALTLAPEYKEDAYYMLGVTLWRQDSFLDAIQAFEDFLKREETNDRLIGRAKTYLANSHFAYTAVQKPVPFKPVRLSDSINTPTGSEYLPTISADGQTLIFTRFDQGDENFFISSRLSDGWSKARPLSSINTPQNEGSQTVSADGRLFIFTACNRRDGMGSCDLYYAEQIGPEQWSAPRNLGAPVNTRGWESQPSLSADGRTLYFAAERSGGLGGRDIWKSERLEDGAWSTPQNLGAPVNTTEFEQSPFIHPDGQTLYFMSKGHPGMGGYDLYLSRLNNSGQWSEPENLGFPVNTKKHEGALFISLDGKTAYFATDRADFLGDDGTEDDLVENPESKKNTDIFQFELHPGARPFPVTYVKARVFDATTKKTLQAAIEFTDIESGKSLLKDQTNAKGEFLVCLPAGKNYGLFVDREDYLFHSEHFALKDVAGLDDPYLLDIFLSKIGVSDNENATLTSAPVILKNVFFETASAALRPESKIELTRLKELLVNQPGIRIQINGHTDSVGKEEDNQKLSEARAKAVYQFLVDQGISPSRMTFKGFGESRPIDTNDTPEGRQNNRRTEFELIR